MKRLLIILLFLALLSPLYVYSVNYNLKPGDTAVCNQSPCVCPHPDGSNVRSTYMNKNLCLSCHEPKAKTLFFKPFDTSNDKSGHRKHLQKRDPYTNLNISCRTCHNY